MLVELSGNEILALLSIFENTHTHARTHAARAHTISKRHETRNIEELGEYEILTSVDV